MRTTASIISINNVDPHHHHLFENSRTNAKSAFKNGNMLKRFASNNNNLEVTTPVLPIINLICHHNDTLFRNSLWNPQNKRNSIRNSNSDNKFLRTATKTGRRCRRRWEAGISFHTTEVAVWQRRRAKGCYRPSSKAIRTVLPRLRSDCGIIAVVEGTAIMSRRRVNLSVPKIAVRRFRRWVATGIRLVGLRRRKYPEANV